MTAREFWRAFPHAGSTPDPDDEDATVTPDPQAERVSLYLAAFVDWLRARRYGTVRQEQAADIERERALRAMLPIAVRDAVRARLARRFTANVYGAESRPWRHRRRRRGGR